jgi:predicted ABC-type ATPase
MPNVMIIAGPNGAGKTTIAPYLFGDALHVEHFVNADTIAAGLSAFSPDKAAVEAGKSMLKRMRYLADQGENFAFETTLASRMFAPWLERLKKQKGYCVHLTFLWLESPDLAVSRVNERVKKGGHFVSESIVRRRYEAGLKNFFRLYLPIADTWQMYDNNYIGHLDPIATKHHDHLAVYNHTIWQYLWEHYHE